MRFKISLLLNSKSRRSVTVLPLYILCELQENYMTCKQLHLILKNALILVLQVTSKCTTTAREKQNFNWWDLSKKLMLFSRLLLFLRIMVTGLCICRKHKGSMTIIQYRKQAAKTREAFKTTRNTVTWDIQAHQG